MADTKRFRVGGAEVTFGTVTIPCEGGVDIDVKVDTADVFLDETGTVPQDTFLLGGAAEITVNLGKASLDTLAALFPNTTQVGTGDSSRVEFRPAVGTSLKDAADELTIKPYVGGVASTDKSDWVVAPLASPTGSSKWSYKKKDQLIFPVTFKCYPDANHNNRYLFMGDELYS